MACQKCGSIIQDGLSICPVCGADLTVQSTYKKVNEPELKQVQENISAPVIEKKGKNKLLIILVIVISIVAIVSVLFVSGIFNVFKSDDGLTDIKTVNDKVGTTTSSTTKKTTSKVNNDDESVKSGDNVLLNGMTFTVPLGFTFGKVLESEETKQYDYYLMRKESDALINMGLIESNISFEEVLSNVVADYEYDSEGEISTDNELKTYGKYKYYKLIRKEKLGRDKYKEHTIILMKIDENLYLKAYLYETVLFGEQNYLQVLTKFIDSKK